jgi:hypothetical protein
MQRARPDMNKNKTIILKIGAVLLILVGLLAMLVAWLLMLGSGIHNSTVMVLEMGGVVVCMAGIFLRRRTKASEMHAKVQDKPDQSLKEAEGRL